VKLSDILPASVRQIESFVQNRGRVGISTTWDDVDRAMGGAGAAGACTSWLPGQGAERAVWRCSGQLRRPSRASNVLVFATEMIPEDVGERLLCHQGATDKWAIFRTPRVVARFARHSEIQDWPIWIDRRETPTIGQIAATSVSPPEARARQWSS